MSGANGRKMKIITRWIVSAEIIGLAPLIMIITLYNADLILPAAAPAVHETRQFCFLRVSGISAWLKYQPPAQDAARVMKLILITGKGK